MGMDLYLFTAHSKKELEDEHFFTNLFNRKAAIEDEDDTSSPYEFYAQPNEVYYARKFWDLFRNLSFTKDYECGDYIPLERQHVQEMLKVACEHEDYFGDFNTVPSLCRLLKYWDILEENHLKVFFECDW